MTWEEIKIILIVAATILWTAFAWDHAGRVVDWLLGNTGLPTNTEETPQVTSQDESELEKLRRAAEQGKP